MIPGRLALRLLVLFTFALTACATVDFVYAGGDGYGMLDNRTGVTRVPVTDTLRDAIAQTSPLGPPGSGRIAIVWD